MRYYLGLDNGGTTTKAAIFSMDGKELGVASVSTAMLTPRPNFVERDMEEMWQANCQVIRQALAKTGVAPKDIAGVGICGHGKGLYLWGKDGKPARNGILSGDNRAYAYAEAWKKNGVEEKAFALSRQHVMACQPVALLAWLRDNEPETMRNVRYVFSCKDYARFRLTGEARSERTDASGNHLLNLNTQQFDAELLRLFGIESVLDALPPLCASAELCGGVSPEAAKLCGLLAGTPVIGGMFDIDACALAVNVTDERHICMIAGTWSINEYPRKSPVVDGSVLMNSLFCLPGYYLIEESSATSAGNNEWFIRQLLPEVAAEAKASGKSVYDVVNEWVASVRAEEFVPIFLPFIMASNVHPNAKASFVGMSVAHTREHLARSVYEGVAFCHRYHLEKLLATRDRAPESIRLAGGAARSAVWTQMFADVMNLPVETVAVNETGALGCAVATAVAVGDFSTFDEAAARMCAIAPAVRPDPARVALYDRKYELYKKTLTALDGLWSDMEALVEASAR